MTEPQVVEETLILIDANGEVTENRKAAVRGEVSQRLSDGTTRSTLFDVDSPTSR